MVALPDGKALLLALGGGGVVQVDVQDDVEGRSPRLSVRTGAGNLATVRSLSEKTECLRVEAQHQHIVSGEMPPEEIAWSP